ncbi:MAG: DNA ligase, partial [Pseudoxanthomonas sp.]
MDLRIVFLSLLLLLPRPLLADTQPPPRLMLATNYHTGLNITDYWVSEKLDGVRGRWDGQRLLTRSGQPVMAPAWFTANWPKTSMDGELWTGRGRFDEVSALVRAGNLVDPAWRRVRFMVFDLPEHGGAFEARVLRMRALLPTPGTPWLQAAPQFRVQDADALQARLRQVVAEGGEGLMLHRRGAMYRVGRSEDLIKYKTYEDAEARVVGHMRGKGKYAGLLG